MPEPTDHTLWLAWLDGDTDAGEAFVQRHFLSVHRFFSRKVGPAADELTQRTFLGLIEGGAAFEGRSSIRSYLYGIARIQLLRHFEGRGLLPENAASTSLADLGPSPSRVVAQREGRERLHEAMMQLPLDHQLSLELHYWEGLSVQETAEALGVAPGTIKSRLARARERLRETLGDDDGF